MQLREQDIDTAAELASHSKDVLTAESSFNLAKESRRLTYLLGTEGTLWVLKCLAEELTRQTDHGNMLHTVYMDFVELNQIEVVS